MAEYKIVIESKDQEIESSLNPQDIDESTNNKLKEKNSKKKDRETTTKTSLMKYIQAAGTAVAVSRIAIDPIVQTVAQTYQLQGETLKAQRLSTSYSNITQNIDMGLQFASSLALAQMGNPIALATSALQIAQRAFQLALQNRAYTVKRNLDLYKQTYMSERLVRNISEVR